MRGVAALRALPRVAEASVLRSALRVPASALGGLRPQGERMGMAVAIGAHDGPAHATPRLAVAATRAVVALAAAVGRGEPCPYGVRVTSAR